MTSSSITAEMLLELAESIKPKIYYLASDYTPRYDDKGKETCFLVKSGVLEGTDHEVIILNSGMLIDFLTQCRAQGLRPIDQREEWKAEGERFRAGMRERAAFFGIETKEANHD